MSEIILVNVTGKDRTGLVARVTGVLAEHGVHILDVGQAVIHDYISLGLLVEIPAADPAPPVLKDLLFVGHELGVEVRFRPTTLAEYEQWVSEQGRPRHIITLLGRKLSAAQISRAAAACAAHQLNIDVITRLSGRPSLVSPARTPKACVQITASGRLNDEAVLRAQLLQLATETGVDVSFQADDIYRRNRRLVVFDMDSTLIQAEVIDELAKEAGVGDEVAAITAAAMRGELDFRQSLIRRVALLRGLPESTLTTVAARLRLTDGAELVASTLKRLGYKTGIISGGFDYFGQRLQRQLGFDYMYANWRSWKGCSPASCWARSSTVPARLRCCARLQQQKGCVWNRRLPSVTAPMTCPCSALRGWGWLSTPNRSCVARPAARFLTWGWMGCFT